MTKLQGEDLPTYVLSYPRWVRWSRTGAVVLLVGIAVVGWVLAWVSFLRPLIEVMSNNCVRAEVAQLDRTASFLNEISD